MGWFQEILSWFSKSNNDDVYNLPVVESDEDINLGQFYRYPDDPVHVVRIRLEPEELGAWTIIEDHVSVAGTSHREKEIERFLNRDDPRLGLERDPQNKYDRNAIKVMGISYDDRGNEHRVQIGWVPSEIAASIAQKYPETPLVATLKTIYLAHKDKQSGEIMRDGFRFEIWAKVG